MVIRRRHTDKARFYGCEKVHGKPGCGGVHIVAEPLERLVADAVLMQLDESADDLQAILSARDASDTAADDLQAIRADESALEQLARDHYTDRIIGRAEYLAAREVIASRLEAARERLGHQNGSAALSAALGASEPIRKRWDAEDLDWRRRLVSSLVDHVEVRPVGRGGNRRSGDPLANVRDRSEIVWRY
jgi:hypothetical protein